MVQTSLQKKEKKDKKRSLELALKVFDERLIEIDQSLKLWLNEVQLMKRILKKKANDL